MYAHASDTGTLLLCMYSCIQCFFYTDNYILSWRNIYIVINDLLFGLQCFDAVGWVAGRASGL